jgi:hypothetical protein
VLISNSENMVIKIPLPRRLCHNYMLAPYIPSPLTKGEKVQDEGLQEKQYFKCFLVEPLTPALSRVAVRHPHRHICDKVEGDSGRGGIGVFPATPRRDEIRE